MEHLKDILEQRGQTIKTIEALDARVLHENRNYTNEEKEQFDNLNKLQAELGEKADTLQRSEQVKKFNAPEKTEEFESRSATFSYAKYGQPASHQDTNMVLKGMALAHDPSDPNGDEIPAEYKRAAQRCGINNLRQASIKFAENPLRVFADTILNKRSNVTTGSTTGANAVDGNIVQGLVNRLVSMGGILSNISYRDTADGGPISFATGDDSSNTAVIVAENTAPADGNNVTSGTISWGEFIYRSNNLEVSYKMLRDAKYDFEADVIEKLYGRINRKLSSDVTVGAGTTLPFGYVTKSTEGVVSTNASYLLNDFDNIINLKASVDEAYQPNAKFSMHRTTATNYRLVRRIAAVTSADANVYDNAYAWQPSLIAGQPDTLDGTPIIYNPFMVTAGTANKRCVVYGDHSKYIWRNVGSTRMVIDPWTPINKASVNYQIFFSGDGNLSDVYALYHLVTKKT